MKNTLTTPRLSLCMLWLLLSATAFSQTGLISTYAGNGHQLPAVDNVPATSSGMDPIGLAVDTQGNLYIADANNPRVRRVDAVTGIITAVGGSPLNSGVNDVKLDSAGNLYFCGQEDQRVLRMDAVTGVVTAVAGTGATGFTGDGGPATSATLAGPDGLAVDGAGNIYIADQFDYRVRRVDGTTGIITTVAGTGANFSSGDGGPASVASFSGGVFGLALDSSGNLFISEISRIRRIDAITGIITTVAGTGVAAFNGDGIPATLANVTQGYLAVDAGGSLFIGDDLNNRVRRIDPSTGLIWTVAGNGSPKFDGFSGIRFDPTATALNVPIGVAINPGGLFISEIGSSLVRKVALPSPFVSTALTLTTGLPGLLGAVPFTASLSASNGAPQTAGGFLVLVDGRLGVVGSASVQNGVASFDSNTALLAPGSYNLRGFYLGDSVFAPSNSLPVTAVVPLPQSAVGLQADVSPTPFGQQVTLTAVVTPNLATGTVSFFNGAVQIGSATLANGTAQIVPSLAAGTYSFTAQYSGDIRYPPNKSQVVSKVIGAVPSLVLTSAVNPSTSGQLAQFEVSITPLTNGATVQLSDLGAVIGSVGIGLGVARLNVPLTLGAHSISATFTGNANFVSATSNTIVQTVLNSSSVALASTANPSVSGQAITFTAGVTPANATGSVQFSDLGAVIGSAPIVSGVAAFSTASLIPGTHSIAAAYTGDGNTAPATSNTIVQTVLRTSSVALTSTVNPSVVGQPVSLVATVAPASATGTVQFADQGTVIGSAPLMSGMATFSRSSLTSGAHSITAIYSGDASDAASTSNAIAQTVLRTSAVAVTSSGNPSFTGQAITFTASVLPSTATGSVQFLDGTALLGAAPLGSGVANFSASALIQGTHAIRAVYSGDGNFAASSSALLTQNVNTPPPVAPSALTATDFNSTQIDLAWTASPTGGVTYDVYASSASGFTPSPATRVGSGITGTTFSHTGLAHSTAHFYRVTAMAAGGESAPSNQATATTAAISCHVGYKIDTQWNVGFKTDLTIENTGQSTMNGWDLTWTWPGNQKITESWNSSFTQTGTHASVKNATWNAQISPGDTADGVGFNASYSGSNTAPAAFFVNGVRCR